MASKFAITAELNLQTKNLTQVVNNLKQQFQGVNLNIKIKDLANAESQIRGIGKAADGASRSVSSLGNNIAQAAKRFSAITLATGTFVGLTRAIKNAVSDAVEFEREMVKIAQATGKTVGQLRGLELEVGNIATSLGASSKELIVAARNLTQAGFAADKVTGSLKVLAQTDLAATFKSIEDTTEGAIAILNQFGREAQRTGGEVAFLEKSLSAINQVSKDFAVESSDLITAVKTTGSAFESAGGSLNELIALFTSVRSTTRESAESIATGFRTIFTRVQRVDTMNNLRDLGIELQDIKGQFVGPMEAAKRLSVALATIDPKDFRFNLIVEQLGGFRQVSKVIPLIQQFAVAQKALGVAQNSSGSLAKDAATAQQSLAVQIQKTREEFLRFVKELTQSSAFQDTVSKLLQMANAFIQVGTTLKPLLPLIASFGALKIGQSLLPGIKSLGGAKKAQGGRIGFATGGLVPGSGNGDTVPAMLTPGEFVIKKSSVKKLGIGNLARVNKYAEGGPIEEEDTIGAAILSGNKGKPKESLPLHASVVKPDGTKFEKDYRLIKQPLSQKNATFFKVAIEKGLISGLQTGIKQLNSSVGMGLKLPLPDNEKVNFLLGLNDASYGNAFENILSASAGSGKFDANQDPKRPFDFTNGLGDSKKFFSELSMKYIDAKASFAAASDSGMLEKLNNQLAYEFNNSGSKTASRKAKAAKLGFSELKKMKTDEAATKVKMAKGDPDKIGQNNLISALQDTELGSMFIKDTNQKALTIDKNNKVKTSNLKSKLGQGVPYSTFANMKKAEIVSYLKPYLSDTAAQPQARAIGGLIHLAKGGLGSGTDTVPAMLTPGEYVINKKSAQAIGYASLNRMNKVGKFANGGPVQYFTNGGTPTGQFSAFAKHAPKDPNFVSSNALAQSAQKLKEPLAGATEAAAKFRDELNTIIEKGNTLNSGFVLLASGVASVASQMSGMDKEYADMITAFSGTFATINGIGQNLKNMGFAQIAAMKADREHKAAVEADKKALQDHSKTISDKTGAEGTEQSTSKFGRKLNIGFKAVEGAIMGYAAASAIYAAKIAATNAKAEKAGDALNKAMEKFATSANNEVEVRNSMIQTLVLSEKAQADYNASTSNKAIAGGAIGGGIGAVLGGALGSIAGPAGTAIGVQLGTSIGSFAGTFFGTELAKNFDEAKIKSAAGNLSDAFTIASKGTLNLNKYFEKIDEKPLTDVTQEFAKVSSQLAEAQQKLSSFDPDVLKNGSEQMKAQFNKAADTVRNFEISIGRLSGAKLQKLTTKMSDAAKLGVNFDIGPVIKEQQAQLKKVIDAKYNPDIERATKSGNKKLAAGLTNQRDQEFAQAGREAEKALLEIRIQLYETEKALAKERAAREQIIGSLIEEKALKTTLQNFNFAVQKASKSSDQLDAAFGDSVSGLKSSIPDPGVFDLEMPEMSDLEPALKALRTIGPIGENLATSLLDLNKVVPDLEVTLNSLAKSQMTGGIKDIDKTVADTIEQGLGVSMGSAVGKRLFEIISGTMKGRKGEIANANPSIETENTKKAIMEEFSKYAESIKSMSKETLQAWAQAEQEQLKILDKINQSENRKLELTNQGVDSYGRMLDAVHKAYGKNVPLAVKNMQRFAKQFNSIGKTAYTSVQSIGKNLRQAKGQLAGGVKDPLEAGKIQNTANRLEQSLKTLANQSERTSDTLAELEKFKAQREAYTNAATGYAFGSDEQRKSKDDAAVALQQVMAAGGDLDAISSDMRGQVDSLLSELGDAGKNIKKQLTANFFAKRGNMDMANMVMSETSGPEQKLIAELQNIYQEEIAAQKELKDLEMMYGTEQIKALNQVTDKIKGFNDQLRGGVQKGQARSKAIQKAAGVTDSTMTTKQIDEIINTTKTQLDTVNKNIETFGTYIAKLNTYMEAIKNPKSGAALPANPGAPPAPAVAKAKGGIIYKADGGFTPRGTDTVPAMLTPGEYVIKKSAVDSIGVDNLDAINNGYASGGLVNYLRRGGRPRNYGRSGNARRQRAIARAESRRSKREASEAIPGLAQGIVGGTGMDALQPSSVRTGINMTAGLKPATPAPFLGGVFTQEDYGSTQGPEQTATPTPYVLSANQRQINIDANLKRASAAAALKEIQAGPEGANAPDFNDSTATSLGKWFNRNIYDRNVGNRGGQEAKDIHRQNVLDKYDIQERNLPEKNRQKEKGPGQFATSVAKKGFFGTIFGTEQRSMSTGGLVQYYARGGRAARARARAAERRGGELPSRQQMSNVSSRRRAAAMRGTSGYLGEMAAAGQTIRIESDYDQRRSAEIAYKNGTSQANPNDPMAPWNLKKTLATQQAKAIPSQIAAPKIQPMANTNMAKAVEMSKKPADRYTNRQYPKSNAPLTAVEKIMQQAKPGWRSASFSSGGAVHLARGGRVGGYSGGGRIRRYQDGGNVDPYTEGGNAQAPQMPDMTGFAKTIESLTAFVGSFDSFSKTMAGLAGQLSSVTVTHNVTFGGQVNVGGISGEGIVNAMKSTIEGWIRDQVSKHPDVQKAVKASDQTRGG